MKNFVMASMLMTSMLAGSAHALIIGTQAGMSDCMPGHPNYGGCVAAFITSSSTSLPTLLVAADFSEMSQEERQDYLIAEAQNYTDGVSGEYLVLKAAAQDLNVSIDELAEALASK